MDKNEAAIIPVSELVNISGLTIPSYQRPYKWTTKNCNELFFDIKEASDTGKRAWRKNV
jgi:uncharacterized protein with ParB-like and HNH nuclease domain